MKAVIMCGGSGTRLWPISRKSSPKQFVKIFNNKSLFQLTIERNINLVDEFIIVVNKAQLDLCKGQVPKIIKDKVHFIIEPIGRNTAPAITLAAIHSKTTDLLVLASDHLIKDQVSYEESVAQALDFSKNNNLVTFGITPSYPEIGYGYIQSNGSDVESFKEKPNLETAKSYLAAGNYYWNSGMFLFQTSTFLEELKIYSPDIFKQASIALENADKNEQEKVIDVKIEDMNNIPSDSIDYAIMEKSRKVKVVPSDFNWSDLGSYDALFEELEKDKNGNTISEDIISLNSHNNLILPNDKLISTFDVENLIIIDTPNAILVGKRGSSQNVKQLLELVKVKNPSLLE